MVVGDVDLVQLLSTYQGRINRSKFWIAVAVFIVIEIAFGILSYVLSMIGLAFVVMILSVVVGIALAIAGVFIGIKRLHDRGKSGWWLLVFMFAPSILVMIGFMLGTVMGTIFSLASLAIVIWSIVELGCLKGDTGPNQYGPDPLGAPAFAT